MSEFFKQTIESLKSYIKAHKEFEHQLKLNIEKDALPEVIRYLKNKKGRLLTMVGNDERQIHEHFKLYYVYAFDQEQSIVSVEVTINETEPNFPSLTEQLPALNWYEREVHDLLGLKPLNHPVDKPLVL